MLNDSFDSCLSLYTNVSSKLSDLSIEEYFESRPSEPQTNLDLADIIPLKELHKSVQMFSSANGVNESDNNMEITINVDNNILSVNDYFELNNISSSHGFEETIATILNKYKQDNFSLHFINTPTEDTGQSFIDKDDTNTNASYSNNNYRYLTSQKYILKKYHECVYGIENLSLYYYANPTNFLENITNYFLENSTLLYCGLKKLVIEQFIEIYRYYSFPNEIYTYMIELYVALLEVYDSEVQPYCYESLISIKKLYNIKPNRKVFNQCQYIFYKIYKSDMKKSVLMFLKSDEMSDELSMSENNKNYLEKTPIDLLPSGYSSGLLNDLDLSEDKDDPLMNNPQELIDEEECLLDVMTTAELGMVNNNPDDNGLSMNNQDGTIQLKKTSKHSSDISDSEDSFSMSKQVNRGQKDSNMNFRKFAAMNFLTYIMYENEKYNKKPLAKHKNLIHLLATNNKLKHYKQMALELIDCLAKLSISRGINEERDEQYMENLFLTHFIGDFYYDYIISYWLNYTNNIDYSVNIDINYTLNKLVDDKFPFGVDPSHDLNVFDSICKKLKDIYYSKYYQANVDQFYNLIYKIIITNIKHTDIINILFTNLLDLVDLLDINLFNKHLEVYLSSLNVIFQSLMQKVKDEENNNKEELSEENLSAIGIIKYDSYWLMQVLKMTKGIGSSLSIDALKFIIKMHSKDPQGLYEKLDHMYKIFEVDNYLSEYIVALDTLLSAGMEANDLLKSIVSVLKASNIFHVSEKVSELFSIFKDGHYVSQKKVEVAVLISICEKCLEEWPKWYLQKQAVELFYLVWKYHTEYRQAILTIVYKLAYDSKYKSRSLVTEFSMLVLSNPEEEEHMFKYREDYLKYYLDMEELSLNKRYAIFRLSKLEMFYKSKGLDEYDIRAEDIMNVIKVYQDN